MQVDFLNSERWLSLVFEGRNKEYGAYVHREESSDRHLKALIIITIVAVGVIFLPKVMELVSPVQEVQKVSQGIMVEPTIFDKQDIIEEPITKDEASSPSKPNLVSSILFTDPVITDDGNIGDEELMRAQIELTEINAVFSIATVDGVVGGINIADVGEVMEGGSGNSNTPDKIPDFVEVMPQFPGGDGALTKWLTDNLRYPAIAIEHGIQGRVILRFVVRSDGSIDEVEVVKGLHPSCDKEALRVVKNMPSWIPGKQNGNPVHVYYTFPVFFQLQNY